METNRTESLLDKADLVIARMSELLAKSEERIDRTNKMVSELCDVVHGLKDAYVHHLDQLTECRDEMMRQNHMLLEHLNEDAQTIKEERARYDRLMNEIVTFAMKSGVSAGTSVNIKK